MGLIHNLLSLQNSPLQSHVASRISDETTRKRKDSDGRRLSDLPYLRKSYSKKIHETYCL